MSRNNDEEFLIAFLSSREPVIDGDDVLVDGLIRIASFEEVFEASLSFWSEQDYEAHWRQQLKLVVGGAAHGLLITSMYDPEEANYLFSWPLWRTRNEDGAPISEWYISAKAIDRFLAQCR